VRAFSTPTRAQHNNASASNPLAPARSSSARNATPPRPRSQARTRDAKTSKSFLAHAGASVSASSARAEDDEAAVTAERCERIRSILDVVARRSRRVNTPGIAERVAVDIASDCIAVVIHRGRRSSSREAVCDVQWRTHLTSFSDALNGDADDAVDASASHQEIT
jgi:hypothetical protein